MFNLYLFYISYLLFIEIYLHLLSVFSMETFYGIIETTNDALILFEASKLGIIQKVRRRLHEKERKELRSGSCYIFSESESGIKRWFEAFSFFFIYIDKFVRYTFI